MKKLILFLLSTTILGFSQSIKPKLINNLKIENDIFAGFDALSDYYFAKNNVFFKKTEQNTFEYKNLFFGKITAIDIQNPLKIVLFYQDFNTIVTLDNQLNESQKLNLSDFPIPINAEAFGISANNSLWIYNSLDNKIGLFNFIKKEYKSITIPISQKIKKYNSDFNNFYFVDQNNRFSSCNIYGKLLFLGTIPDFDNLIIVNSQQIIFSKNNNLFLFDVNKNASTKIEISEKTIENFVYKNQILTIFTTQQITNYKLILE